jgi:hypothetical protein
VKIPADVEHAVNNAVARRLEAELGDRGLLLGADELAEAEAEAAQLGARLLAGVMHRCYPTSAHGDGTLALEFESDRQAARLEAALAFGAVTARVLGPGPVELLCAIFNLGIGLVDSLCDEDAETGVAVLELIQEQDLVKAVAEPRGRGWLRAVLPPALADDYTAAFTVDIIEVFFETLHDAYPNGAWLEHRRAVGTQLESALEAERGSFAGSMDRTPGEQLLECSRLTSVLPFQIIEALAGGDHARTDPTAGTLLGEAMWRIDDLVDLCQDARSGALNGVLLAADEREPVAALARLLASRDIAGAAAQAAGSLRAGFDRASPDRADARDFLYFIQRYAGIGPRQTS